MFSVIDVETPRGTLQYREEHLTGFRCRISPERLKRRIDQIPLVLSANDDCPFCPDNVLTVTPTFADGTRIIHGESVTFPNLYPFARTHVVSVITRDHTTTVFTRQQIADTLHGISEALLLKGGYASINWNFLPSAGASIVHPHMQGIADDRPSYVMERYLAAGDTYSARNGGNYWDAVREEERASERYLFGDEIVWSAHAVPLGEREIRGIIPISTLGEFDEYIDLLARGILENLSLFQELGTHAFNMAVLFDNAKNNGRFCSFCSILSRINPNPSSTSDSAFMERMHIEPIVMTLPEELGIFYREKRKK